MAPPGPRVRPLRAYVLPALFVAVLFAGLWLRRPGPDPDSLSAQAEFGGETMGSTWSAKAIPAQPLSPDAIQDLQAQMEAILADINQKMSTYQDDSELSRFNAHRDTTPFPLSPETLAVLDLARTVSQDSGGAFDITVAPLVQAWGFGTDPTRRGPTPEEATRLMAAVGYQKLLLDLPGQRAAKQVPELRCDLSAIAPGYAADLIGKMLEGKGISSYMVEVGGEVRARGQNARQQPWQIGIEQPDAEHGVLYEVVGLSDSSLATSGDYRKYYEKDGVRISHTIDARTGAPITHTLASVSVLHPDAVLADAYATAVNVLGPEEGYALARSLHLPVLMLIRQPSGGFQEKTSPEFEALRGSQSPLPPTNP